MIAIIDYKAGNAPSVQHAARRIGFDTVLARDCGQIENASHIILPGVGSAGATMNSLREMGILGALEGAVLRERTLFLGICVGMQILFERSEEDNADCLGWLEGYVARFDASKNRVPQMGWNKVDFANKTPIEAASDFFYFVNSYYARPHDRDDIWGVSDYGGVFTAAVRRGNIYGTQFHVEKSASAGLSVLAGFCGLSN
ncbi:MAG: imidazole glycerol phosphate synthase subunit HisH [Oscillospiraceae bacterium]|nr:imidazole glycerol phosphate synthase subunit HisH [Oscillospiraceae bacterium]